MSCTQHFCELLDLSKSVFGEPPRKGREGKSGKMCFKEKKKKISISFIEISSLSLFTSGILHSNSVNLLHFRPGSLSMSLLCNLSIALSLVATLQPIMAHDFKFRRRKFKKLDGQTMQANLALQVDALTMKQHLYSL